jgi:uncharacterized membrane protein YdbT with pleckstrin-like domain
MIEIDKTEKVLRIVRKHWFVLIADIMVLVLFVALPMVFLVVWNTFDWGSIISYRGNPLFATGFFLFAWLFLIWMVGWHMWTDYYLDVFIITDKRIFDITQYGLFRRTSSSFRLDRIQNITVEMNGIIQTLLNFGTVRLETAGEREDFVANYLSHPYELKKSINEMQDIEAEKSQLVHLVGENNVQAGTSGIRRDPSGPPPTAPDEGLPHSRHKIF